MRKHALALAVTVWLAACGPSTSANDAAAITLDAQYAVPDSASPRPDSGGGTGTDAGATGGDAGASGVQPLGEFRDGIATYYDATGAGNCSFDPSPDDLLVAAMNAPEWSHSAVCGACAEVTGPSGSVIVRVVDRCPECLAGHLDLSVRAFERIAPLSAGRVAARWRFVRCDVRGPVSLKWKEGTNPAWAAIQVRNHRVPVSAVAIRAVGTGSFQPMMREDYNYFVGSNVGPGPFEVRLTAQDGQELVEANIPLGDNAVVNGTQQFR